MQVVYLQQLYYRLQDGTRRLAEGTTGVVYLRTTIDGNYLPKTHGSSYCCTLLILNQSNASCLYTIDRVHAQGAAPRVPQAKVAVIGYFLDISKNQMGKVATTRGIDSSKFRNS